MLTAKQALLLPEIYDAALSEHLWPRALEAVVQAAEARGAVLWALDQVGMPFSIEQANSIYTPEQLRYYFDNMVKHEEEAWARLSRAPVRTLVMDLDVWTDADEVEKREDYVWLRKVAGVRRRCAARLNDTPGWTDALGIQYCPTIAVLPPRLVMQAEALLPHVAKVVEIHRSFAILRHRYNAVLAALDRVKIGVCIASQGGEIMLCNREAQRIFSLGDGLTLAADKRITCSDADLSTEILTAIASVVRTVLGYGDTNEAIVAVRRRSGAYPFLLEFAPLKDSSGELERDLSAALIFIVDPENPRPFALENVVRCFNLTEAEALVCALMVRGLTDTEMASQREVSVETIRTQAKSIYRKTGVARRADLIRLTLNITPPIEELPESHPS